jgi:hypothetical protein
MYVKQNGGAGLYVDRTVTGDPILLNAATDPFGDAKRETGGITGSNIANLDILSSSFSQPTPANCHPVGTPCYRVKMTVNKLNLTTLSADIAPDAVAVWQTQWLHPADPGCTSALDWCSKGGRNPFVYFESNGMSSSCWSGENAALLIGGGVTLTYPGKTLINTPGACSVTPGQPGTITIDVPVSDVNLYPAAPLPTRLYSVTASTMTMSAAPDTVPANPGGFKVFSGPIGGVLFDLIDVVRAYDFVPGAGGGGGGGGCHTADGNGDEPGSKGGKARFDMHEDDCDHRSDREDFSDPSAGADFHATQTDSVAYDPVAHSVTIAGLGTDNGLPVAFTIVGVDSSLVPPGLFSITLSDGYTNSGNLLDGSIRLH